MKFPLWVTKTRGQQKQASARLRYILTSVAVKLGPRASIRAFAEAVGCDHSTLAYYVKQGFFSADMAHQVENALGSDIIRADWLTNPLSIDNK